MQYKNLSQALERVKTVYLSGAIEFYAKLDPNPWQGIHDDLEETLKSIPKDEEYFEAIKIPINTFVSRIEVLIDNYKPFSVGGRSSPMAVGFYSSSPEQAAERYSLQEKRCANCSTKERILARKNPKTGNPMIMCEQCWSLKTGGKEK